MIVRSTGRERRFNNEEAARQRIQFQFGFDAAHTKQCTHLRSRPDLQIVAALHTSWSIGCGKDSLCEGGNDTSCV